MKLADHAQNLSTINCRSLVDYTSSDLPHRVIFYDNMDKQ